MKVMVDSIWMIKARVTIGCTYIKENGGQESGPIDFIAFYFMVYNYLAGS